MTMHYKVQQAIQEIDAAIFNGCTFDNESAKKELLAYIERWRAELSDDSGVNRDRGML